MPSGLAAAGAEDHQVEDREDDDLADQREAEHAHGELDVEPAQHADQERRARRANRTHGMLQPNQSLKFVTAKYEKPPSSETSNSV